MDVRLDDEDEFGEEDFDDDIMDAEVVDVEEDYPSELPPEEPVGMPPAAPPPRAGKPGVKKALIVIAVIAIVIVAILVVLIYLPRAPTGITLQNPIETTDGLQLKAEISSESATQTSGDAKVTISFNGSTVYTNDKWKIESNSAAITIPYDEFVVDNGEYTIFTEFEGVSDEITYELDFVLKYVSITVYDNDFVGNQAQFTVSVGVSGDNGEPLKDSEIMISSIEHVDGSPSITSGIGDWQDMAGLAEYVTTLDYQESGNYTFTIDVENNDVKDSSDYASFSVEAIRLVNAPPKRPQILWEDSSGNGVVVLGENVEFDGSNSIDDGDLDYHWSIIRTQGEPDQEVHAEDGAEIDFTFNQLGEHYIYLFVTDEFGQLNSQSVVIDVQL
jgi:hypothetical protein